MMSQPVGIMLILAGLFFGSIFAYKDFQSYMIKKYLSASPPPTHINHTKAHWYDMMSGGAFTRISTFICLSKKFCHFISGINIKRALKFQDALHKRLGKFSLELEPTKTRLVEFGRFAHRHVKERGKKMKTVYFLGFTHFCSCNRKGSFMVRRRTEKSRFRRSVDKLYNLMRKIRHFLLKDQTEKINQVLRGHYAYYGLRGNIGLDHY